MENYCTEQGVVPFSEPALLGEEEETEVSRDKLNSNLPAGWRRFSTGLRDTRLYHISLPNGTDAHWQAEMIINFKVRRRRFASQIHARWWLAALDEPFSTPRMPDAEELNEPWRARSFRSK